MNPLLLASGCLMRSVESRSYSILKQSLQAPAQTLPTGSVYTLSFDCIRWMEKDRCRMGNPRRQVTLRNCRCSRSCAILTSRSTFEAMAHRLPATGSGTAGRLDGDFAAGRGAHESLEEAIESIRLLELNGMSRPVHRPHLAPPQLRNRQAL